MAERNYHIPSYEVGKTEVKKPTYLTHVRNQFGVKSICYPGCEDDTSLETAFLPSEITYVDNSNTSLATPGRKFHSFDIRNNPFQEEFDALFIQDLHIQRDGIPIDSLIGPLKPGGLLMYSLYTCPEWKPEELEPLTTDERLLPIRDFPEFTLPHIILYRKISFEDELQAFLKNYPH